MKPFRSIFTGICVLGILILGSFQAQSQETRYQGPLRVAGYKGEANYQYYIIEGDTLRNGPFRIQRSDLESLLQNKDTSFLFSGNYKDNIPEGTWRLKYGSFTSGNSSEVVDYQYRVLVNGIQQEAVGMLRNGLPEGMWNVAVNRIENSEVAQSNFKSKVDFEKGIPHGSFQIEDLESALVGRFLRDGLAHDQWTLFGGGDLEIEENWYFEDGVLQQVETKNDGEVKVWQLEYESTTEFKTKTLGEGYLQALRFQTKADDSLSYLKGLLPSLLVQNDIFYHNLDTIFTALGTTEFYPKWKVKLAYYPLDSLEQQYAQSIHQDVIEAKVISDALLNSSQLNLLALSDEQAAYGYAALKAIRQEWLKPLGKIKQYYEQDLLDYMKRPPLVAYIWPNGIPSATIDLSPYAEGKIPKATFVLPDADHYDLYKNNLMSSAQAASYALESLKMIQKELEIKLGLHKGEQELLAVEQRLIVLNDSLQTYVDSVQKKLPKAYHETLLSVGVFAEKQLSDYAMRSDTALKTALAEELVVCFKELNQLGRTIGSLPQQRDSLKKHYTDGVWNPFMATVMEEEVKKRILAAYDKVLVPYFLKNIETSLSCETAKEFSQQIQRTNQRMFALRDEETKKLERKLRKEKDPETVLELFNLGNSATKVE
ncbi:hypothetical protein [Eudoraea chungangensis]|uniref:hypothetical protein n=1 Tax=Eudoraea chungangensis TaxID=1481905 RepID=UPI0023ED7F40|nr:hypothetical protein [Eudoraea chungangensis]